jgi:hypothetical protein
MNLKTTYILFGVLLAVLILFAVTQFVGMKSGGGGSKEPYVFADFHSGKDAVKTSDVDEVRVERASGSTLAFKREKGAWQMTEPFAARADLYNVDNLVRQVSDAEREKGEPLSNPKEYGLEPPQAVVTLKKGDQEWKLNVGKQGTGVVYVSNAAKPDQPMPIRKSSLEAVFKNVNDFRSRELLTVNSANATSIQVNDKAHAVALDKTSDGRWRFAKPAYGPANLEGDTTAAVPPAGEKKVNGVRDLIDTASGLRVEADNDFVADNVSDADLAEKYGLAADRPETLRVEAKVKPIEGDTKTEVLLVGKKTEKTEDKKDDKKPETKTEYYYVRMDGEKSVVRVPAAKVKPLVEVAADPKVLRSRDLVTTAGAAKIDAVDVTFDNNEVKLREVDHKWTLYHGGARATDTAAVNDLIEALTGQPPFGAKKQPPIKTFMDKEDGLGFDKPSAVVSVWIDGVKKEEKKDDDKKDEKKDDDKKDEKKDEKKEGKEPELANARPTVTLTFGRMAPDNNVYVRRESDGDKVIGTVSDSLLKKVTVTYLGYLERKVPTFSTLPTDAAKDVTKLTLVRGGQTWEVTKETAADKTGWKFAQPQAMAGRSASETAIGDVLRNLATLTADKIVSEKPSDADLELFGLKSPENKATVTIKRDDKIDDWVYSFGKQTETKMGVYMRLNKSDLVFLVPNLTVDNLKNAELRDLTVFNFDMKQVKGAKITVWSNDLKSPVVIDLERKGDRDWAKKDGPITPDGPKVENFIASLGHLRATKFVTPKPNTDTGLDVSKKALKVEIQTESGPLELLVGNEDPDNKGQLFASSNKLPGDILLLPEATFKDAKSSPAHFAK